MSVNHYMSGGFNRSDIIDFFLVEASEHLQILNDGLLALEENHEDLNIVDEIFRSAHTIKGSAAMLGFTVVSKLAHKMEDLLGKIRSREISLTDAVIDLLLHSVDTLNVQIESLPSAQEEDVSILQMFEDLYAEFLEAPESAEGAAAPVKPEAPAIEPAPEISEEEFPEETEEPLEAFEFLKELEPIPLEEEKEEERGVKEEEEGELPALIVDQEPLPPEVKEEQAESQPKPPVPAKQIEKREHKLISAPKKSVVSESEKKFVRVEVEGLNLLMNLVGELVINRTRLDQRIAYVNRLSSELSFSQERLLKVIRDFKEKYEFGQLTDSFSTPPSQIDSAANQHGNEKIPDGFFELEFDKYDDFNILSRSLVEIGVDISEVVNQLTAFFDQFEDESSQIRRITDDLQEKITNIRMVQVGQLFNRFHRTIRDVSKQEAKTVTLKISGSDAKLDKTVIDEIADPLMHLVRNAVSHGIESPDVREERGKPREGVVSLNAYKEADNIIIEVADDGGGIDVNRIRETIAESGLRSMAEVEKMPDDEVIRFIFEPGFSTRKDVSSVSGRGVGMDVVKTNIAKLGGTIDIKIDPGRGTKFSIKLPLTLIIHSALLVRCGDQEFAISLTSVDEAGRISLSHIHNVGTQEVIKLRDEILPLRRLSRILQYNHDYDESFKPQYVPIVIVHSAEQVLALMVDELIGRETIVIKPLGDYLKKIKLFSGATISGEGKVRLILDISAIIEQEVVSISSGRITSTTLFLGEKQEQVLQPRPRKVPKLILVDDSISIRKVVGMFLTKAGYHVEVAVDGVEAIEKISKMSFDLIITDLEMPRMHGYELIAEVRREENMKQIPIIVLTSRAGEKHYAKAMELGVNDYIVKPVEEGTLLESVRKLLEKQGLGVNN